PVIYLSFWNVAVFAAQGFLPDESASRTIHQLEANGQIQTAPSAFELWWWNLMRQLRQWWNDFWRWVQSLFPSPNLSEPATQPSLFWLKVLFISALVLALLAAALLVWRAYKNRPRPESDDMEMGDIGRAHV